MFVSLSNKIYRHLYDLHVMLCYVMLCYVTVRSTMYHFRENEVPFKRLVTVDRLQVSKVQFLSLKLCGV